MTYLGLADVDTPDEVEQWQAVAEPAPPMEPGMKLLVETELDVTVRTFYKEFLSDDVSLESSVNHICAMTCYCCEKVPPIHPSNSSAYFWGLARDGRPDLDSFEEAYLVNPCAVLLLLLHSPS